MNHFNEETLPQCGVTVRIRYFQDTDSGAPWTENDCHGPVREVFCTYGYPGKLPGEVILHSDRGNYWLYDVQAAVKQAKAEGWGCKNQTDAMTRNEVAAAAVKQDMQFLQGWLKDDWFYVGVVCTVMEEDEDGEVYETCYEESCWGYESFDDYHETAGREMAQELAERVALRRQEQAAAAAAEAVEVAYWASRDVVTEGGV